MVVKRTSRAVPWTLPMVEADLGLVDLAVGQPWRRAVDRFATLIASHLPISVSNADGLLGYLAVRLRPDVQQEVAVLADVVNQIMDERGGGLVDGIAGSSSHARRPQSCP